jgi:hypothetical protein
VVLLGPLALRGHRHSFRDRCYYSSRVSTSLEPFVPFPITQSLTNYRRCANSRRRRKQGLAPRYGTGWMAPAPKYGPNNGAYVPPPPQYSATPMQNYPQGQTQQPQYTGQTFNSNEGYYGGHNEGVAPPPNTYYPQRGFGGENVYEPPAGPPPGKHA